MQKKHTETRKVAHSAIFLAIALVLRNFSYMVPFGGQAGMRIGVSGFFSKLPALLFGPVYGGLTNSALDILGYLLKPEGEYLLPITISAACGGILTGLLWKWLKNVDYRQLRMGFVILFAVIALLGAGNHLALTLHWGAWEAFLLSFKKKTLLIAFAPYVVAALGFAALGLDALVSKLSRHDLTGTYLKLLVALGVSDILVTTFNTYFLMWKMPSIGALGFTMFYTPRLVQEVVMVVLSAYVISILLELYNRAVKPHI